MMASALRQTTRLLGVRGALGNQVTLFVNKRYIIVTTKLFSKVYARTLFMGPGFERSLVRDVERMMNNFARTFDRNIFPFWHTNMPRALPVSSVGEDRKPTYRLNIDMSGFNPEDIKSKIK